MFARKKALVVVLAGAGLCVACLAVYLCRDTLLELWYERQLRSDDPEARRNAAEGLLGMKSIRSLSILLEYVERPDRDTDPPVGEFDIRRFSKVVTARGPAVVPQLREARIPRHDSEWPPGRRFSSPASLRSLDDHSMIACVRAPRRKRKPLGHAAKRKSR